VSRLVGSEMCIRDSVIGRVANGDLNDYESNIRKLA
jgi:hypothetical protein